MADHWRSQHDNVISLPARHGLSSRGSRPTTREGHGVSPVPCSSRGISDSAVRDFAALVFALIVFGIPGIGVTLLLIGWALFFA